MLKTIQMLIITAAICTVGGGLRPAIADDTPPDNLDTIPEVLISTEAPETLSEVFNQFFFDNTGNFYEAVEIGSQINTILGYRSFPGSYPETEVVRDAELLNNLYRSALEQQVASEPPLRTPDLNNPFDTSLRLSPAYLELGLPQ